MSNIEVFVRMRPFNERELAQNLTNQRIQLETYKGQIQVTNDIGDQAKHFVFDGVFDKWITQQQIYQKCNIEEMVHKVIEGYNSTILTYGQTGAGKTYTMQGNADVDGVKQSSFNTSLENETLGIIPRVLRSLFNKAETDSKRQYKISLSFVQIYKQNIYDLFNSKSQKLTQGLKLRWNKFDQFTVDKLKIKDCISLEQALKAYLKGASNKIIGKHKMNLNSSRSHSIFTIRVQSVDTDDRQNSLVSKFCLVDLAGSEKQQLTGTIGKHFKESIEINKSLFTLRQVITALVEQSRGYKDYSQDDHYIPYRDSKLTSLLKQSFGGNNYTTMIACLNPGDPYVEQSLQTLSYAGMTNKIKNVPIKGEDEKIKEINKLKLQLGATKQQLTYANKQILTLTTLVQQKSFIIEELKKGNPFPFPSQIITKQNFNKQKIQLVDDCQNNHEQQLKRISCINSLPSEKIIPKIKHSRSNEQILQSISIVKELVSSNMVLRQNNDQLTRTIKKKQKQLVQLMKQNDSLRNRWDHFFSQFPEERMNTLQYQSTYNISSSSRNPQFKTTQRLQPIRQLRKKRQNSISIQNNIKDEHNLSYNQFINSRYRVKTSNTKPSKKKKYAVL